jgi:hypothetical protein
MHTHDHTSTQGMIGWHIYTDTHTLKYTFIHTHKNGIRTNTLAHANCKQNNIILKAQVHLVHTI